jgi:hypothetical protein
VHCGKNSSFQAVVRLYYIHLLQFELIARYAHSETMEEPVMKRYIYWVLSPFLWCAAPLCATITIENLSATPVRVTRVTLWQSQGVQSLPIPYTKNITVEPGSHATHSMLTDGQDLPIIELTLQINGVPYQFTLAHEDQEHNVIRINPEMNISLEGKIQRVRATSTARPTLPAGVYAV